MVLSDIATISTVVSGFAVTASLIYVGIQTKQNVRHTRALIHQGTAARTTNLLLGLMNSEAVGAWLESNGIVVTPEAIRQKQIQYQCRVMMVAIEDYYTQHEFGLLNEEQFSRGRATFRERLREPGLRAAWLKERQTISKAAPRYCAFVDCLCGPEAAPTGHPNGLIGPDIDG